MGLVDWPAGRGSAVGRRRPERRRAYSSATAISHEGGVLVMPTTSGARGASRWLRARSFLAESRAGLRRLWPWLHRLKRKSA